MRDAGYVEAVPGRRHRHLDRRGDGERQDSSSPGTTVTTVKLKIPSTFAVTVANHGNCPVRGIEVHLIEGNAAQQNQPVKSLLPGETVTKTFAATGNPGEVKIDVAVPTVAGESNATNNHYTYHVAFQS